MNLDKLFSPLFCFLIVCFLVACGSQTDGKADKPKTTLESFRSTSGSDSIQPEETVLGIKEPIEISFSNFENLIKKSKLLSDKEAFSLGLDTTYWDNYLARELCEIEGCALKLVFSVIENQQLGYLVYLKNGKVLKKIDCYMDDQVEMFRIMSSRIDKDLILHLEKESSLEVECAYVKLKQDLKSLKSKPVIVEQKCQQSNDN